LLNRQLLVESIESDDALATTEPASSILPS
jgi:hypothetical protein